MTPAECRLRTLLKIWTGLFGLGAVCFVFAGNPLLHQINYFSQEILKLNWPLTPLPVERFWVSLAGSLMATLTVLCFLAQRDVRGRRLLIVPVLVSKAASTLLFTLFFFWDRQALAYLAGGLFCDGPIFLITWFFYRRAGHAVS